MKTKIWYLSYNGKARKCNGNRIVYTDLVKCYDALADIEKTFKESFNLDSGHLRKNDIIFPILNSIGHQMNF